MILSSRPLQYGEHTSYVRSLLKLTEVAFQRGFAEVLSDPALALWSTILGADRRLRTVIVITASTEMTGIQQPCALHVTVHCAVRNDRWDAAWQFLTLRCRGERMPQLSSLLHSDIVQQ